MSNLASAYRGLNNLAESRRWAQRAIDLKIETSPTRRLLYQIELMEGHLDAADAHLRWAHDRPREFDLVSARAQWLAWQGRMHDARDSYRLVTELTLRRNLTETAGGYQAHLALTEALYGNKAEALASARQSLFGDREQSSSPDAVPRYRAAAALALAGDPETADTVLREMLRRYPQSTLTNTVMRPVVGGASAIVRGQYADAIARLKDASDYELGTVAALVPVYLRGVAYLGLKDGANAAEQFQRILDHPGHGSIWLGLRARAARTRRARWRSRTRCRRRSPPTRRSSRRGAAPTPTCRSSATLARRPRGSSRRRRTRPVSQAYRCRIPQSR